MERFKKLGVFLDGSPADDEALQYAGAFAGSEIHLGVVVVPQVVVGFGRPNGAPKPPVPTRSTRADLSFS